MRIFTNLLLVLFTIFGISEISWSQTALPYTATNSKPPVEYRSVNGKVYEVNSSPEWKTIVIPSLSALRIAGQVCNDTGGEYQGILLTDPFRLCRVQPSPSFNGTIIPQTVVFQIPSVYNFTRPVMTVISNYPYTPKLFQAGYIQAGVRVKNHQISIVQIGGYINPDKIVLRVYPLSKPTTNYDAVGRMFIKPAEPIFDCGVPTSKP